MRCTTIPLAAVVLVAIGQANVARAITINQIDDFQDGTTQGWAGQALPTNIPSGGPAGIGDTYLQISPSPMGRLGTVNLIQWAGDYLTAGVDTITMDLNNFGPDPVEIRIMAVDLLDTKGGDFTSTIAAILPPGSGWQSVSFGLSASDLTHVGVGGTDNLDDTLAAVDRLLIRHDVGAPNPTGQPTLVSAVLGIDNITALAAPEVTSNGVIQLSSYGRTYVQDFDGLGAVGSGLPTGWESASAGTTNITITNPFPTASVVSGTYNAGSGADRTLATGNIDRIAENAIQLWGTLIDPVDVRAVVLEGRIEAWFGDAAADNPGEAAVLVSLEFDPEKDGSFNTAETFNGGTTIGTGKILSPGALDGNGAAGSVLSSGLVILPNPIPAGSDIRLTLDAQGVGQTQGYIFGLDDLLFRIVAPGDTNGDGIVNSVDLFNILSGGKFNHAELGPGTWGEGDFTGDTFVNSADLFAMLSAAKFNAGPYTVAGATPGHGIMTATIDPATGNITLDASSAVGVVSGLGIFSAGSIFNGDSANIDPGVDFVNTDEDFEVSTGLISLTGTNDLGNIIGEQYRG